MMDPDIVNSLTAHLIGKKPNTYTYTKVCTYKSVSPYMVILQKKALGESLLQKEGGDLPIAIVRLARSFISKMSHSKFSFQYLYYKHFVSAINKCLIKDYFKPHLDQVW